MAEFSFCLRWSAMPLVCLLVVMSACPCPVVADEKADGQKSAETAQKESADDKAVAEEEKPLFEVPDGTPSELLKFIEKVKRTPPKERTREAVLAHLKAQIDAMLSACEKIFAGKPSEDEEKRAIEQKMLALRTGGRTNMELRKQLDQYLAELEKDERPFVQQIVVPLQLQEDAARVGQMSEADRDAFLKKLFEAISQGGVTRELYSVASAVGRALTRAGDSERAVALYERLASEMEKSDDEQIRRRAARVLGAARQARLPGNFLELKGRTADGREFNWDSYRGKVVLVDFWASWCGPCRAEIPNMKAQLEKYGDKGFAIVGVNLDQTREAYEKYVKDQGLTWENLMSDKPEEMGWDNPVAVQYGVSAIPTAILVDKEGKVVSMNARGRELNRLLEELLGPVDEPEGDAADGTSKSAEKPSDS